MTRLNPYVYLCLIFMCQTDNCLLSLLYKRYALYVSLLSSVVKFQFVEFVFSHHNQILISAGVT